MASSGRGAHVALVATACLALGACGRDDAGRADTLALAGAAGTPPGAVGGMTQGEIQATLIQMHESEIEAGNLARERATNAQVRQFAQRMVNDHTNLLTRKRQQMSGTAGATGAQQQTPAQAGQAGQPAGARSPGAQAGAGQHTADAEMTRMHQDAMQRLRNLQRGAAFDREYMSSQVAAHEAALRRLDRVVAGTGGAGTTAGAAAQPQAGAPGQRSAMGGQQTGAAGQQQLLQETRQSVQAHLEEARRIQQQLGTGDRRARLTPQLPVDERGSTASGSAGRAAPIRRDGN